MWDASATEPAIATTSNDNVSTIIVANKPSAYEIVGIAIVSLMGIAILVAIFFLFLKKRRKRRQSAFSSTVTLQADTVDGKVATHKSTTTSIAELPGTSIPNELPDRDHVTELPIGEENKSNSVIV
jgi:hypothetical protein